MSKTGRKIKEFQSAFEVKDLAATGTCRQVTLLTLIDTARAGVNCTLRSAGKTRLSLGV